MGTLVCDSFVNTAIALTRFKKAAVQGKIPIYMASEQVNQWLIESPTIVHLCVTRPSKIFVESPTIVHLYVTRSSKIFATKIIYSRS